MMHKLITVCHRCHYNLHDHRAYGKRPLSTVKPEAPVKSAL
jgi:hypothetical protein